MEAVAEAGNQVELLAALQNAFFKRVNADFIADYDAALTGVETTTTAIQTDIDAVNYVKADAAVDAAELTLSRTDLNKAIALVDALKADGENETSKANLQERVTLHSAVISVNEANTNAKLTAALTNLANLSDDLDVDTVNPSELSRYRTLIADAGLASKDSATDIQARIDAGNVAAETAAVTAVAGITATTSLADVKAKLLTLANRSAFGTDSFDKDLVIDTLVEQYRTALKDADAADKQDASEISTIVTTVNNPAAALTAVAEAATADALLTALKDKTLNLSNVVDANKAAYYADAAAFDTAVVMELLQKRFQLLRN